MATHNIICPSCLKRANCFPDEFFGVLKGGEVSACKCGAKLVADVKDGDISFRVATKQDIKALNKEGKKLLELFTKAYKKK